MKTLQETNNIFKEILSTKCDELLIDKTKALYNNTGMLREILWRYKSYTFWVEYMHFESPDNQANALLKDVVIFLKLKFKAIGEEDWAACTVIEEFLGYLVGVSIEPQ